MIATLALLLVAAAFPTYAQDDEATPAAVDDDVAPAPPSIGADVPLTYFGPAPSTVQKELVGPLQLLRSGTVDQIAGTTTIPLYRGQMVDGTPVWYVLTDTTDKGNADALGLNWSPKLSYAVVGNGARTATLGTDATLTFDSGTVDFSLELVVTPGGDGEAAFPPPVAEPESVGDEFYTPLVKITNAGNQIYNAPIVAYGVEADDISFCDGGAAHDIVHDKIVNICPDAGTVTLRLTAGFSFAKPVLYLSFDASDPVVAALEESTLAPGLLDIAVGGDDSVFSAVERIFITANGPLGDENPQCQGLSSALNGQGSPLNVLGGIPTVATDYSPLWDANLGVWTDEAVENGYRSRLIDEFQILGLAQQGWITGPDGADYGSVGIIINCPIVMRFL